MSVENECNLAYRYRTVQKHLDGLGYKQTLPLDSLPLVENLLADLIQTTESLKHFKSVAQDNIESCSQLQLSVNPYKCDNARLVQENNDLNVELMREKESHQKELFELKKRLRRVEAEHGDLQLSSSRNLQRIKELEAESANKSKKILELQGKCCKPVVSNVSLAAKKRTCYPLRRPLLECETLPKTKTSSISLQSARQVEPFVVDFVAMADLRMNCLNYEVTQLKEKLTLQTDNINTLDIQLALKEKEISRLRRMLEGGRPYNAVAKECSCNKFEKTHNSQECREIENCDLKIILKAKTDLEYQLKEALNKQHEAMSQALKLAERNEELEKELRDIDHIALSVEADCNTAVKENNRRVCRLQERLNEVMTQVHALECELAEERRRVQELKTDLGASRLEKLDIQQTLEFTLEEKKNLTDRINQLTAMATRNEKSKEHIFNQEEEILKSRNREISNDVQRILYEKESSIVSNKLINLEAERDYFREEYSKCRDKCSKESRNESITVERLQRERDLAKGDVERLVEERDALRERLKMAIESHSSVQQRLRENLHDVEKRLKYIECERQELITSQGTKRSTINGLEDQLEDLREELKRTKQELAEQRTQYFQLRALQDQTDQALGDVQGQLSQSETELTKAIDRNRNMEQQQIDLTNQVKDLKQEINTLHTSMAQIDHEKDQLLMVLDEKTEKIASLERELQSKEQQMINAEQQLRDLQHKNQICVDQSADKERQVRSMQIDMDNLQRQMTSSSMDRENAIQENMRLQDDLAAVTCELRTLQRELDASRAESFDLKKQLKTYVSEVRRIEEILTKKETERTEMLNHFRSLSLEATVLENSNHSLESEAAEARGALQSARDRLLDLDHQVSDKENLIKGCEAQIINLTQNVATLEAELRQQEDQRIRAESDLNAVRDLCVKLDQQKDNLLQQLGEKDSMNSQFESQLTRLRTENSVVQDQINRDNAAIDRLEDLLDESRQESMNTQTANQELQNEILRLKQKNSELHSKLSSNSSELKKYQNQAAEYSKQVSELRRQVTNERFDRARKEEETRSILEKPSSCCHCQSRRPSPSNSPNTPREYNRTSRSRHFSSSGAWERSPSRYFQLMPEENTICPSSFPSRKLNKSDTKSSSCRCTFYTKSKEISSTRNNDIPESCNSFEFEKSEKQGDEIPRVSLVKKHEGKDDNNNNLTNKKLSRNDYYQSGIGERVLTQKGITSTLGNEEETLKLKEPGTKNIQQIDLIEKLTENSGEKSVDRDENNLLKLSHTNLKDTSIQTDTESKKCCENLREEIFNILENFKEQSHVRQTVNSPASRGFLSNTQMFGTGMHNPTYPNLESSTFGNRPFNAHSPKVDNSKKTTYSNDTPLSYPSSGNFVHRLEEKKDCLCCGTELTLLSNETTKSSKDSQNLDKQEEKEEEKNVRKQFVENNNSDDPQIVDASRPEFVDVLIEIGQYTRSLERQLAQMNEAMRSRINETNAWSSRNENTEPVGTSTPKEAKTDERIFLSLSNYKGSDIANFSIPEEESASEEERVTNNTKSKTIKEINRDNQLLTLSPIGTSTPVIEKNKVTISKKSTHDNGQISNIHLTASKKIILSNQIPGPSTNNQSSNLKSNMFASKSSDISLSSFLDEENKNKKIQTDDNNLEETQYKDFPRSKRK